MDNLAGYVVNKAQPAHDRCQVFCAHSTWWHPAAEAWPSVPTPLSFALLAQAEKGQSLATRTPNSKSHGILRQIFFH